MSWHGKINGQKAYGHKEEEQGLNRKIKAFAQVIPIQEGMKGRKYEPKNPYTLHATKDTHQLVCTIELNKRKGSRNGVKARKKLEHT